MQETYAPLEPTAPWVAPHPHTVRQDITSTAQEMMTSAIVSSVHLDITVTAVEMLFLMDSAPKDTTAQGVRTLPPLPAITAPKVTTVQRVALHPRDVHQDHTRMSSDSGPARLAQWATSVTM